MPNPIQIKRPDVADEIRELAALTGESLTDAVGNAVRAQLAIERVNASRRLSKRRIHLERALAEFRKLPVTGPVVSDRDLYGPDGLPK